MNKDDTPSSFLDDQGRFYKPYQSGARAAREVAFYNAIFFPETKILVPYPRPFEGSSEASTSVVDMGTAPKQEDVQGLLPFIPKFYGIVEVKGSNYIVMEDLCTQYKKPCVIDCKLGFTTVYEWAEEKYKVKNTEKDATTTQSAVGFRISGLQVYQNQNGSMYKTDRQWGKTLTKETISSAFELFANNGNLQPADVYSGALPQLRKLVQWAERQTSLQFFQASVLLMYEGEAKTAADAKVRVAFVDFAHTFQSPRGVRDDNLLSALNSLISIIEKVSEQKAA